MQSTPTEAALPLAGFLALVGAVLVALYLAVQVSARAAAAKTPLLPHVDLVLSLCACCGASGREELRTFSSLSFEDNEESEGIAMR